MSRLLWLVAATVGGAIGWKVGSFLGPFGAVVGGAAGTAFTIWYTRTLLTRHL